LPKSLIRLNPDISSHFGATSEWNVIVIKRKTFTLENLRKTI
jgi:hypothetical protein